MCCPGTQASPPAIRPFHCPSATLNDPFVVRPLRCPTDYLTAGGDDCVPGLLMVRPGDRTSLNGKSFASLHLYETAVVAVSFY
ncbi:MAG: hypothetical protein ACI30J_06880 [Paludibacteraceae bacterium]